MFQSLVHVSIIVPRYTRKTLLFFNFFGTRLLHLCFIYAMMIKNMEVIILEHTSYNNESALSPEEEYVRAQQALQKAQAEADALRERKRILAEQMEKDEQNLDLLTQAAKSPSGEASLRLQHIIKVKGWERNALVQASGVGRTTLYRYTLMPEDQEFKTPSKKNLLKILDALGVSVHDFCAFPDDFEKWKKSFDQAPVDGLNLFAWRDEVLDIFQTNTFVYDQNGHKVRMPQSQFDMFKNAIEGVLGMLDMLPHDAHSSWPDWTSSSKK